VPGAKLSSAFVAELVAGFVQALSACGGALAVHGEPGAEQTREGRQCHPAERPDDRDPRCVHGVLSVEPSNSDARSITISDLSGSGMRPWRLQTSDLPNCQAAAAVIVGVGVFGKALTGSNSWPVCRQ
jgi:hypothetical protein